LTLQHTVPDRQTNVSDDGRNAQQLVVRENRPASGATDIRKPGRLRVPTKPAMHSNSKPAGYSNRKPATLGVYRMGRFDDVVEG
jgi:hypothetical protein